MDDILGRIVSIIVLVIALVMVPVIVMAQQIDNTTQAQIDNAIEEFVDNARASGKITANEYEKMMRSINIAQPLCNVQIYYGKRFSMPDDESKSESYEYFDANNETYILNEIYTDAGDNEDFYMMKGDKLEVYVRSSSPTFGLSTLSVVLPKASTVTAIVTSYGGYVEHNGIKDTEK